MPKEFKPAKIEETINIHKACHDAKRKHKAERAIKEITKRAQQVMGTEEVKIDQELNSHIWSKGKALPPNKVRVVMERKADEESNKWFTVVSYQHVASFSGLHPKKVLDQ